MAHRCRERALEMRQAIEELVAMRDQLRAEATRFRHAEAKAAAAAREAQERPAASGSATSPRVDRSADGARRMRIAPERT
jgi:hypothetical protein